MHYSRRQLLRMGAAGLLSLPLAGCFGPTLTSRAPAETLAVACGPIASTLDPHAWHDASGPRTLAPIFDALTFIQSDGKLRPALALAWAAIAPTTWQFRLRVADAKFHNGEMFAPDAVRFTFERLRDAGLPLSRLAARVERVDIVDPATVNLVTAQPDAALPRWISAVYVLPPRYFTEVGPAEFARHPVGTGFWMPEDWEPGSRLSLRVFRDAWRNDRGATAPPPLKRLLLNSMNAPDARAAALRNRDVDVATELTDVGPLRSSGFVVATADIASINQPDTGWQTAAFGQPLAAGAVSYATMPDVKGVTPLPNGSWWLDRVTKTSWQRVAVAGGA